MGCIPEEEQLDSGPSERYWCEDRIVANGRKGSARKRNLGGNGCGIRDRVAGNVLRNGKYDRYPFVSSRPVTQIGTHGETNVEQDQQFVPPVTSANYPGCAIYAS